MIAGQPAVMEWLEGRKRAGSGDHQRELAHTQWPTAGSFGQLQSTVACSVCCRGGTCCLKDTDSKPCLTLLPLVECM